MNILKLENVSYSYQTKYQTIEAVKHASFTFATGKMYAITGESGSGKSTLLSLMAGLDLPSEGHIFVNGTDMSSLDRDQYRCREASVIYQAFHLFSLLTAKENVMFPLELRGIPRKEASRQAENYLQKAGLPEKIYRQFPPMMSGGEQQRVAIARAMAAGGKILLADEPTGNLDTENEKKIVELLKAFAREDGCAVIVITHNPEVAAEADKILRMCDGILTQIQ